MTLASTKAEALLNGCKLAEEMCFIPSRSNDLHTPLKNKQSSQEGDTAYNFDTLYFYCRKLTEHNFQLLSWFQILQPLKC